MAGNKIMKDEHMAGPYEGRQEYVRSMTLPKIDVWENKYSDRTYRINIEVPEFTCICPKTGLPDFACIHVEYSPDKWCIELKSFKEYIILFRDLGIFHEHVVNRILEDIVRDSDPKWARVKGVFNPRGGISTTVEAEYSR